jgi:hypothetical protein
MRTKTNAAGMQLKVLAVDIPAELHAKVKAAAAEECLTATGLVRFLLKDFIAARYSDQQPVQQSSEFIQSEIVWNGEESGVSMDPHLEVEALNEFGDSHP